MNIYVAGNFEHDRETVATIAYALEWEGDHTITWKWWDELGYSKPQKAALDLDGIRRADVLVVYMEKERRYQGTWVEVGYALALSKPVFFIGPWGDSCLFRHHTSVHDFYDNFPARHAVVRVREALK